MTQKDRYIVALFLLLAFIWGSSFILIKKSLVSFEPFTVSALRVSISSICFAPIVFYYRNEINWNRLALFILIGLTGSGIPAFLYPLGQSQISSSLAGVLNALTPLFTFIFAVVIFKSPFRFKSLVGLSLGFVGTSILILYGESLSANVNIWYALFIVGGTICYGLNVNLVKSFFQNTKAIIVSSCSFFIIGPPAMLYLLLTSDLSSSIEHPDFYSSLAAVTTLSVFGTVLSTVLFFKLIQKTSPVLSASVSYLIPIVAILWGIYDGEIINLFHILGMLLIVGGIYLIKNTKTQS